MHKKLNFKGVTKLITGMGNQGFIRNLKLSKPGYLP